MDPQKITELANLLRQNGDKILSSEFTLTLSGEAAGPTPETSTQNAKCMRVLDDDWALLRPNTSSITYR